MAASGLLQSENVVFYQPLNSGAVEFCQDREWISQFGAYTETAKIEEGWLGLGNGDPTYGSSGIYAFGRESSQTDRDSRVAWIDQNRAVIMDRIVEGTDFHSGVIVTHSGDGSFTTGPHITVPGWGFELQGRYAYGVDRLTPSSCVMVHESGSDVSGVARLYSISGNTLTLEDSIGVTSDNIRDMAVVSVTPSSFVVCWSDFGSSRGRSVLCTVENNSLSVGSISNFHDSQRTEYINGARLSNSGLAITYREAGGNRSAYGQIGSISDTTITWGTRTQYSLGSLNTRWPDITLLSYDETSQSGNVATVYGQETLTSGVACVGSISGTSITFPATGLFYSARPDDLAVVTHTSGEFGIIYSDNGLGEARFVTATWDGALDISFGSDIPVTDQDPGSFDADKRPESPIITTWHPTLVPNRGRGVVSYGLQEISGSIATSGVDYASASGETKLAMCGWFRRPTVSGTIEVERDYKITIGSGSISLGSGTAIWDGSGVQTLLGTLNDGEEHFVLLDFENAISFDPGFDSGFGTDDWKLLTSLDGSGFVDQGVQTSGSQEIVGTNSDPAIRMFSGTYPVWLDEVVLWANQTTFTDTQLNQLYQLGNTFDLPLNDYDTLFGPQFNDIPLFISGSPFGNSLPLSIPNVVGFSSNSLDLFTLAGAFVGQLDLFMQGASGATLDLFIKGKPSGQLDLFVEGIGGTNQSLTLYEGGFDVASGQLNLFVQGFPGDFNAFVNVENNNPSNGLPLFVHGVIAPGSSILYTTNEIPLFIFGDEGVGTLDAEFDAIAKVSDDPFFLSGIFDAFVRVGNTADNAITLYIQGHASGQPPAGISVEQQLNLFVEGLGLVNNEGYTPISETFDAFARVFSGTNQGLDLFISGEILPTNSLNLYTFGVSGFVNSSVDLSMTGHTPFSNSLNLSVFGISGVSQGSLDLFIEADFGVINNNITLYVHGF